MVRSMTGYGRAEEEIDGFFISVELKSVNSRYFEFSSRVSRGYSFLEEKLKSYVRSFISRGKVECILSIDSSQNDASEVLVNLNLAKGYVDAVRVLSKELSITDDFTASSLCRFSDIFTIKKDPLDEEKIWLSVKSVLDKAINRFIIARETEGQKLKEDVVSKADGILSRVEYIEKRSPETAREYYDKLLKKMKDFLSDLSVSADEQRIMTEAAIFADKIAVDEETVRLRSHVDHLKKMTESLEPSGRKLDFIVQEMNREANTIGSKANDLKIAETVIDIKSLIEKIREQIQNIE